ncbi:MAG: DMT family transporter [Burkholderiales bacterium]|nr:DMT family transporter [Burkholderiales bacterium]
MPTLTHRRAVLTMICAALLWSIAGVVTRQLESARGFELTFWRSAFNAIALAALLVAWRGPVPLWRTFARGGRAFWLSGLCWCVMYTAFMVALTLTTVANVLVTMALAPLFTALLARGLLGHRLALRTWVAIAAAGLGIAWMYGAQFSAGEARHLLGTVVALAVPLAAATNWTLLQHLHRSAAHGSARNSGQQAGVDPAGHDAAADMLAAVLLGAVLSAALALPLAWPLAASAHDLGWLALLGVVQLAIPCLMAVVAARSLSAPEASLLALLEVLFGVAWAWIGAGEAPATPVLAGGALVLAALAGNELPALVRRRARPMANA